MNLKLKLFPVISFLENMLGWKRRYLLYYIYRSMKLNLFEVYIIYYINRSMKLNPPQMFITG
jgi:hypothetical protein